MKQPHGGNAGSGFSTMSAASSHLLICSCEKSMPLDEQAIGRGCPGRITQANQLCGLDLERYKEALADGGAITVACTQEAPLFREIAENSPQAQLTFVNIREAAGWSNDAAAAGPKSAALIAAAGEDMPPISVVTLESQGVVLIYGCDEVAIEAAQRLADRLDITVLLTKPGDVTPRRTNEFPVLKGTIRNARGHLGRFELAIDDYALPLPSSRAKLVFGPSRDGATSTCDLILDLSGGAPMFPAHELRPGYLRADPRDRAAVERAIADAGGLVGTFDKPRFIDFNETLCAHSRSAITGCTRCLDLCPTGAITPNGNSVLIDANVCAGCGSCASVCPTGAASYALPSADALMRRLRTLLLTFRKAGGSNATVLFHDGEHGEAIIDALARFGSGLPANVLPLRVNEVTQLGPEIIAAVFAYGGSGVAIVTRARPRHDILALRQAVEMTGTIISALGFGADLLRILETDDPDQLRVMLDAAPACVTTQKPAGFIPRGSKRSMLETTFRELHLAAPLPVDIVPLGEGAPFGGVNLNVEGCTLCHACVTACPTAALSDNPERAMLRFTESLCVQCGLCESTCPEKVITLEPRLDFKAWNAPQRVLKEEEPFNCIACGKPFGTKSSIERVLAKLGDKHWMFQGANARRVDVIKMCADCRVEAVVNEGFDPHAASQRPPVMTSEDYLRARDASKDDPLGS
jgi:ferredoxin